MTSTNCVVTGGAGFIGCALSESLVDRFDQVIAVDCLHPQVHKVPIRPAALAPGVRLMPLDITNPVTWDAVLAQVRPTTILHLAAETGTAQSMDEAARHAHTNVTGTTVMLDALARHKVVPERIILCSSRAVYGDGAWRNPESRQIVYPGYRSREQLARGAWDFEGLEMVPSTAPETRATPASIYGSTKLAQEHILRSWAAAFGTLPITLRLQNVYGPGQSLINSYTGIVTLFCRLARAGKSIPLYEDGKMLRDFVLIDDVVAAILLALQAPGDWPHPFDIGTGEALSIADVAAQVAAIYHAPNPHVCSQYRFGDVRHAACDISFTERVLGWRPKFPISVGLPRLKTWIDGQFSAEKIRLIRA